MSVRKTGAVCAAAAVGPADCIPPARPSATSVAVSTTPVTGMPFSAWNFLMAATVRVPATPSGVPTL